MKFNSKRAAALAMAASMCLSVPAFAAQNSDKTAGDFTTSFDIYSPTLTVSVPLNLDVEVNPFADSSETTLQHYSVASQSMDIWNASTDTTKDIGIPVNVEVQASIASTAEGVVTEYGDFTADSKSTKKKIHLDLVSPTAPTVAVANGKTPAWKDATATDKKLDLQTDNYTLTAMDYKAATNKTAITKFGSLLSVDIVAPAGDTSATAPATKYGSDPMKVIPAVGSFAVVGTANSHADWKETDVKVNVSYKITASNALNIKTPGVEPTTAGTPGVTVAANTDATIVIKDVGEATVEAIAVHNDKEGGYGDYIWDADRYEVTYAEDGSTTGQMNATIKISKDGEGGLAFLAANHKGEAQDLCVRLSDGRMVVGTLTQN